MIEAYKKFWEGYVDFEGRSTRSDYWFAYLVNALITWGLYIVVAVFGGIASIPLVGWIILIVLLCKPSKVEYPFNNFNNPQQ